MVRERVGDWRLAWRFALAGIVAGLLVITLAQTGVTAGTFDAGQDTLFPAPSPDPQITFVALDSRSQRTLGAYPWNNSYHAQVINYLAGLHPKAILFDIVLDHPDWQQRGTALRGDRPAVDAGDPGSGKCSSRMQRRIGSAARVFNRRRRGW